MDSKISTTQKNERVCDNKWTCVVQATWNQIFTFIFLFEALVRIVADGLIFTRTAYVPYFVTPAFRGGA